MANKTDYQTSQRLRDEARLRAGSEPARLADLFGDLTEEATLLIRQEVALARAEIREKVDRVERGAASLSAGIVFLNAALLVLLAAGVFGLALIWPFWLSALAVGGATLLVGGILLAKGRRDLRAGSSAPRRTMETVRNMPGRVRPHPEEEEPTEEARHEEVR